MMEPELRAVLKQGQPGQMTAGRIDWLSSAQGAVTPYLILTRISATGGHHMKGPDGLTRTRVQIDTYAADFAGAVDLGRAVRRTLDGYRGGSIAGVFFAALRDLREDSDGEATAYRVSQDFMVNSYEDGSDG